MKKDVEEGGEEWFGGSAHLWVEEERIKKKHKRQNTLIVVVSF